jgi:hypothetical protein
MAFLANLVFGWKEGKVMDGTRMGAKQRGIACLYMLRHHDDNDSRSTLTVEINR